MKFRSLSDSIFTDALNSLEMALLGGPLEEEYVKGIIEHKKAIWREMEQKEAESWVKEGIKYAQDEENEIDLSNIQVVIDPYTEHIDKAFQNFNN